MLGHFVPGLLAPLETPGNVYTGVAERWPQSSNTSLVTGLALHLTVLTARPECSAVQSGECILTEYSRVE